MTTIKHRIRLGHDPYLDWAVMLAASFVVACILVAFGFVSYQSVGDRLAEPPPTLLADHSSAFDADALSGIVSQLDARSADRAAALRGYSGPADPSL